MQRKLLFDEIKKYQEEKRKITYPLCAIVENIRSMYNVGSIFRTADGVGVERLTLTGYTATPPRKEISKTALGSTETVVWDYYESSVDAVLSYKEKGYRIVAFEHAENAKSYTEIDCASPLCLVFGNEVDGVSQEVLDLCDDAALIPMNGSKESLNVSVAFGVALYGVIRAIAT